jgi:hypothetical protein
MKEQSAIDDKTVKRHHVLTPLKRRLRYISKKAESHWLTGYEAFALRYAIDLVDQHYKNLMREKQGHIVSAKEVI